MSLFDVVKLPESFPPLLLGDLYEAQKSRNEMFNVSHAARSTHKIWRKLHVEKWLVCAGKVWCNYDMSFLPFNYHSQRNLILEWLTLATGKNHLEDCSDHYAALDSFLTIAMWCLDKQISEAELELVRWCLRYKGSVRIHLTNYHFRSKFWDYSVGRYPQ